MRHEFKKIEPKWQKKWAEQEIFKAVDGSEKPKFYGLVGHCAEAPHGGIQCAVSDRF